MISFVLSWFMFWLVEACWTTHPVLWNSRTARNALICLAIYCWSLIAIWTLKALATRLAVRFLWPWLAAEAVHAPRRCKSAMFGHTFCMFSRSALLVNLLHLQTCLEIWCCDRLLSNAYPHISIFREHVNAPPTSYRLSFCRRLWIVPVSTKRVDDFLTFCGVFEGENLGHSGDCPNDRTIGDLKLEAQHLGIPQHPTLRGGLVAVESDARIIRIPVLRQQGPLQYPLRVSHGELVAVAKS